MKAVEKLIRKQDWIYEDAGTRWQDGLILGNGNLGVVGYAPYGLEWVLNKGDVFDGGGVGKKLPHDQVMKRFFAEKHTTVGFLNEADESPPAPVSKSAAVLNLRFGNETSWGATRPHRVRQRLSLWEGELYNELDLHLSHPRVRCIVPRDTNLLALRLQNAGAVNWAHALDLTRPCDDDLPPPRWEGGVGLMSFEQAMTHGARYAVAVLAVPTGGPRRDDGFQQSVHPRVRVKGSRVGPATCRVHTGQIPQHGNADIFVSVQTSYEARDPRAAAIREVRAAARSGFTKLERHHRAWWRRFWNQGWADFGAHREIQRYWTFSLYETASLLGRAPVPGLYGLWHGPTDGLQNGVAAAWYTHDQNVEIPMMPIFALNRPELVEPFADTYLNMLPTLRRQTRRVYGKRGAVVPLCLNQAGGDLSSGGYRYSLMGGAYTGIILVWAWQYTRDRALLRRKLYPLLREVVRFHVDCLTRDETGTYHLDYEIPPEIGTMSRDATATLGLLRPCLETLVETSQLLKRDASERRHWQEILDHYPPYPLDPAGGWHAGADVALDHCVQAAYLLYPFFPGETGDPATAARTLDQMASHDIEMSYCDTEGRWHYKRSWAWFFPTVARLRLGRRDEGWAALADCLRLFSKPNGLFSHNPNIAVDPQATEANLSQIPRGRLRHADGATAPVSEFWCHDSGSCATAHPQVRRWVTPASEGSGAFLFAATETLLQSHDHLIRLFPGVPRDFTGRFERLLARGTVEVSATMSRGRVTRCQLRARQNTVARLRCPWRTLPALPAGASVEKPTAAGRVLVLPLRRGRALTLTP